MTAPAAGRRYRTGATPFLHTVDALTQLRPGRPRVSEQEQPEKRRGKEVKPPSHPFIISSTLPVVPVKLVKKIWSGEYVDMAELLRDNMEVERRQHATEGEGGSGAGTSNRREIPDLLSWLHCFSLYAAVVCERYPNNARELSEAVGWVWAHSGQCRKAQRPHCFLVQLPPESMPCTHEGHRCIHSVVTLTPLASASSHSADLCQLSLRRLLPAPARSHSAGLCQLSLRWPLPALHPLASASSHSTGLCQLSLRRPLPTLTLLTPTSHRLA